MPRPAFSSIMLRALSSYRRGIQPCQNRYDECVQELERLTAEVLRGQSAVSDSPMLQARMRESGALHEYKRTLQIYSDLILWGRVKTQGGGILPPDSHR